MENLEENKPTIASTMNRLAIVQEFCKKALKKGVDYGTIVGNKQVLFKSGAEKLANLLGVKTEFLVVHSIMDYEEDIYHFHYSCQLKKDGVVLVEADGIASSRERKWNKKPFDYSNINIICKIAQKRAFVAAVLLASCASEMFTQDLEDH